MKNPTLQEIFKAIRAINEEYEKEGFRIVGVFGSYARDEADLFSDIDMAYRIDVATFHPGDAFAKLEAIERIRERLQKSLRRRVDLVPYPREETPLKKRLEKELKSA
jgi:predicted nucleotidyltransferase